MPTCEKVRKDVSDYQMSHDMKTTVATPLKIRKDLLYVKLRVMISISRQKEWKGLTLINFVISLDGTDIKREVKARKSANESYRYATLVALFKNSGRNREASWSEGNAYVNVQGTFP